VHTHALEIIRRGIESQGNFKFPSFFIDLWPKNRYIHSASKAQLREQYMKKKWSHWTPSEDKILQENYKSKGSAWCAFALDRKRQSIWDRAKTMGIQTPKEELQWPEKEIRFVKDNYYILGPTKIAKQLGRSSPAVSRFAKVNGLRKQPRKVWPAKDTKFLIDNYKVLGVKECAKILRRTIRQCYGHYQNRKLAQKKPGSCLLCDWDRGTLDSAHLIPERKEGPKIEWNIVHLCPNCHRLFDHNLLSEEELKKLQPLIKKAEKNMEKLNACRK